MRRALVDYRTLRDPAVSWHTVFPWKYSWLADDLQDGSVASWTPGTGGQALVQSTASAQPIRAATSGPNGQPGITFDGVNDFLDAPGVSINQPDTIVIVGRYTGTGGLYVYDGITTRHLLGSSGTVWRTYAGGSFLSGPAVDTAPHVWTAYYAGAGSRLRVEGAVFTAPAGNNNLDGLQVARSAFGGMTPIGMVVAAIGIASGDATAAAEWSALAALIDSKWGLLV